MNDGNGERIAESVIFIHVGGRFQEEAGDYQDLGICHAKLKD